MWKCPVCETEYDEVTVCPKCGFDGSCDYEHYPTAFAVAGAKSTRALRREWEQKQIPPVSGGNRKRTVFITQDQASQGCRVTAGYVDGKRLELTVPAGTKDGSALRCSGLGQSGRNGGKSGDLLVTVRVQEPPEPDGHYDAPKDPPAKQSELTPTLAAQGCTRSIPFKHNGKETSLTLFIPAGVVYGEKLHYPQVRADDGTLCDVTLSVVVQNDSFLGSLAFLAQVIATLPFIISLIVCIFTSFSISIFTDIFSISLVVMIPASIIRNISQSRNKKKYGPKTPEEKRRCETPREMPPQR